jgi:serine/threonine protein phosphatase PrpC
MARLRITFKTERPKDAPMESESFLCKDNLFVVAEGVGGDYLGEMAKEKACRGISSSFFKYLSEERSPGMALVNALKDVNEELLQERKKIGKKMAASVSVAYVPSKIMYFSHLGDSRIYCLHKGEIVQLTKDHTVGQENPLAEIGDRDPRILRALTDGLGIHERPDIKLKTFALEENDIILMTTEGLTRYLSNMQIQRLSLKETALKKLSRRLIDEAKRKGARDSMTLGVIRFEKFPFLPERRVVLASGLALLVLAFIVGYRAKHGQDSLPSMPEPLKEAPATTKKPSGKAPTSNVTKSRPPLSQPVRAAQPKELPKKERAALGQEIKAFVEQWKDAWEQTAGPNGDMDGYLSFYSEAFHSQGLDKKGWRKEKAERNRKKQWITIELEDVTVRDAGRDGLVEARFLQDYRSSNYSVKSSKSLMLKKESSGWKIVSEKVP